MTSLEARRARGDQIQMFKLKTKRNALEWIEPWKGVASAEAGQSNIGLNLESFFLE
jgi:hypothetical protein